MEPGNSKEVFIKKLDEIKVEYDQVNTRINQLNEELRQLTERRLRLEGAYNVLAVLRDESNETPTVDGVSPDE